MNFAKIVLGILCSIATAWAGDITPARMRDAATRAVAVLQKSQKTWYTKESCVSCHQQVFPAMAFRAAREHSIPVDEPAALADAQAGFRFYSDLDRAVEYTYVIDPPLGDGYSLIGADAAGVRPNLATAVYAAIAGGEAGGGWTLGDDRCAAAAILQRVYGHRDFGAGDSALRAYEPKRRDRGTHGARERLAALPSAACHRRTRIPTDGREVGWRRRRRTGEDSGGIEGEAAGRWRLELARWPV
jgi:hypothetical protein